MLSPPSSSKRNSGEEDNSGSDASSEVSLEPETDRFGFIVPSGSTVRCVGPHPQVVRQREAKWINIIEQWEYILLKKTNKVKVQCQKGIPASLRSKCWPLLCGATDRMKHPAKLYESLDSQPALQNWVDVIERDLDRQFPFHEMFLSKDGHGQRGLFRVLKAYTQYQPEEGYCQAQGPVAAVLLMNMPAEEAFWCLAQISEQYLPGYYSPLLEGVLFDAAMLTWVLKSTCPSAHKHLQHHGVEPLMFATDWLMCLFTRHLPFNTLLRVWDLFFCHGVRVLLQVAVVLVRRVLGRAEQRKQCQGQMETLERLRGVRNEIQEEDDVFIAEVCSVPLSESDMEKQTEKELEKWRKQSPSSTFDPRGRCQGYRMAWARIHHKKEDRKQKEREKGNLSMSLARSASTLSLNPSRFKRTWRKGGKDDGGRVVRHHSMGGNQDWRSCNELNFKEVPCFQDEDVSPEHKTQSEISLTGQTEQKDVLEENQKMNNDQNMSTQHAEIQENVAQIEARKDENQQGESEERKLEQSVNSAEDTTEETESSQGLDEAPFVENIPLPAEHISNHAQEEESQSQSQVLTQLSLQCDCRETVSENINKTTGNLLACSEHGVDENQTEVRKDEDTKKEEELKVGVDTSQEVTDLKSELTENVQQVDEVKEVIIEAELQTRREMSPEFIQNTLERNTQQQDVIADTDGTSQGDTLEVKYHSAESLAETDKKEESHLETETGTCDPPQAQWEEEENKVRGENTAADVQTDAEQQDTFPLKDTMPETIIFSLPECIQHKEGADVPAETDVPVPVDDVTSEAFSQFSGQESDTTAPELTANEGINLVVHSEVQVDNDTSICDQTRVEETPTETEVDVEAANSKAAPEEEEETSQPDLNLINDHDGSTRLADKPAVEQCTPEQPRCEGTEVPVEEETSKYITAGEDEESISSEPTDNHTGSNTNIQNKDDSQLAKETTEPSNSGLTQVCEKSSRHSSSEVYIRISSSSRGSRFARRLSEDLFTYPEKTNQSNASHPEQVKSSDLNPAAPHQTNIAPCSASPSVQQKLEPPNPPNHFSFFRRLIREEPRKTKEKEKCKMQVPKILIQDFSDKPVEEEGKLSSRERRRKRREQERMKKEEERLRKKREKELKKERERESRKPQTRGRSFQVSRPSASYAESYF